MVIVVIVAIVGMGIFGGWCVCFISSRGRAAYIGMPSKSPLHGDRYLPFLFAVSFPCRCRVVSVSFPYLYRDRHSEVLWEMVDSAWGAVKQMLFGRVEGGWQERRRCVGEC